MPSLALICHVHQPLRLRRCSSIEPVRDGSYFDDALNRDIIERVAARCYQPTNALLEQLAVETNGAFRCTLSITGLVLEQLARWSPATLGSFERLARSGAVEFLGETYHHSLAALYDEEEFAAQVGLHRAALEKLGAPRARVFRNTELIYSDAIARQAAALGFEGIVAEGVDSVLAGRTPHAVYAAAGGALKLMVRDYRRSDDIAFRFADTRAPLYPLTAEKFIAALDAETPPDGAATIYIDYETFGEHHGADSGIRTFLEQLPQAVLSTGRWRFTTPADQLTETAQPELSFPQLASWADTARDTSAWQGNKMQRRALAEAFELGPVLRWRNNPQALAVWRGLLASDHFYYMATPGGADGAVHAYFSPYESPYEAFINYMNALRDFRGRFLGNSLKPGGGNDVSAAS